jgi:hypothetical protein
LETYLDYLNKINRLNTQEPQAYAEEHLPIADDPRTQEDWDSLSSFAQAMKLIEFQKKCVKNLLTYFKDTYNPVGWSTYFGLDVNDNANDHKLEKNDKARYDVATGLANLAQARDALGNCGKAGGGHWTFAFVDAFDNNRGCFDMAGMCNSSFAEDSISYWGFYGANYNATDPSESDFSDERLKAFATSELAFGTRFKHNYAEPVIATGPRQSMTHLLGPHGSACDIFGSWMEDADASLKHALDLGKPKLKKQNDISGDDLC